MWLTNQRLLNGPAPPVPGRFQRAATSRGEPDRRGATCREPSRLLDVLRPLPPLDYQRTLFLKGNLRSVTANTRQDCEALLRLAAEIPLRAYTQEFPLEKANQALQALKNDEVNDAAVLRVSAP